MWGAGVNSGCKLLLEFVERGDGAVEYSVERLVSRVCCLVAVTGRCRAES